jgi:hypothetical protein
MAESRYASSQPVKLGEVVDKSSSSNTSQSQTISESSNQLSSSFSQNMPGFALDSLQQLLAMLTPGGGLSAEEAVAKTPLVNTMGWRPGIELRGPNGELMSFTQAQAFNAQQLKLRESLSKSASAGTPDEQKRLADRNLEIERNRQTQGKYSKEAALADAQNLTGYFARKMMEEAMPGIVRGAEGAGTSQGTVRALLSEQAAGRTAEAGAMVGSQLATGYGQINNQLAGVLEMLTRSDPNSTTNQLLQALSVAKGATQSQSGSQSNQSTKTIDSQTLQSENQSAISQDFYSKLVDDLVKNTISGATKATIGHEGTPYGWIENTTDNPTISNATQKERAWQDQYFIDVM